LNIVWDFPVPEPEPEGADRLERDYSHLELSTVSEMPYNAETPLPALLDEVTDSDLVYVRNHFDVPKIDASDWMLELGGAVESPQAFSLSDITALPAKTLRMTLECAGNGRASMDPVPAGTRWGYGAVSAVEFSGTPLSNLLDQAGISKKAAEVVFHGADKGEPMPGRTEQYVRSLPLDVALKPDTILAWEMNGAPLSTNHGYPLRLAIRVRSLILDSTQKEDGQVEIRGIAWSGDGTISKVEVSWDGGAEWRDAELDGSRSPHDFQGWRFLWNSGDEAEFEFVSRATDSSGQVQPINNRWNRGGYGNNGLHRIAIRSG
jgi:DMSO/TMAO reductase YedYZ molybdopterin-dependent catalytic subunit